MPRKVNGLGLRATMRRNPGATGSSRPYSNENSRRNGISTGMTASLYDNSDAAKQSPARARGFALVLRQALKRPGVEDRGASRQPPMLRTAQNAAPHQLGGGFGDAGGKAALALDVVRALQHRSEDGQRRSVRSMTSANAGQCSRSACRSTAAAGLRLGRLPRQVLLQPLGDAPAFALVEPGQGRVGADLTGKRRVVLVHLGQRQCGDTSSHTAGARADEELWRPRR